MITTLTGLNSFMLHKDLHTLIDGFVAEFTELGLERIDGEDAEYDLIRESLESLPFLAAKKLVVLRSPSGNKQFIEHAERLLANLPESTDVIIVEPKLDKRLTYAKYLKKHTDYKEFNALDSPQLARWLVAEAKARGGQLTIADASALLSRVGANQQLLDNELAKLLQYQPQITRATIQLLTDQAPQSTTFDLLDAALRGNTKQAVVLYEDQRKQKVEPIQIIALLAWQLHALAVIRTAGDRDASDIAREARLNPFVVRKSMTLANRLSLTDIKKLVHQVSEIDMRLKSESLDADEVLLQLIIDMGEL